VSDNKREDEVIEKILSTLPKPTDNLLKRIIWVRDRVTKLGKDSKVQTGGSGSYNAISHDKVTAAIRPKMVQAGIASWLSCVEHTDADTGAATQKGRKIFQHRAVFEITFANVENMSDQIVVRQPAYADDFGDKGPGKAASYAMKYALLKLFMIETGEEDEERIDDDTTRASVIADNDEMLADLYAVAEECFGADAPEMLLAMANRRFYVDNYGLIPQNRYKEALKSLRVKAASLTAPITGE